MPMALPGMGLLGRVGRIISGIGSIFFRARNGGARAADDPQAIQRKLGAGRPLDSGVRSRMGSAFGTDFSHVRTHTDNTASELSSRFNARAFTVGEHVAFGSGEYRPGSLIGDALIAHELAHVVQQGAATSSPMPMPKGAIEDNTMEKGADLSAIGAVSLLWGQFKGKIKNKTINTLSRFRTGLRLQRCASTPPVTRRTVFPPVPVDLTQQPSAPCDAAQRGMNSYCTSTMINEIEGKVGEAIPIVRNAISRLSSSPQGVRSQLWDHFRIRPDDSRIPLVLGQFRSMLTEMEGHDVIFLCSDFSDPLCEGGYRGRSSNCQNSRPRYMQLCGDYSWHVDDPNSNFLSTRSSINWVKTIIHEYAHIGCITPPGILGEGNEFYRGRGTYPPGNPDIAIKNADSYAWFAMEVR
ncbi:MAG: DUF4157 domain-containing protein [Chloroflexi bacterium]|nr:DUF4157 domain-containing protein [Chloroflexota bacterium]